MGRSNFIIIPYLNIVMEVSGIFMIWKAHEGKRVIK